MIYEGKMAGLSKQEIDALLSKIRVKFNHYSQKYGQNKFSMEKFNERYMEALRKKVNLENFLYAEVMALEQIAKDIDNVKQEKLNELAARKEIRKQLDDIAEKHHEMIASYPDKRFHPDASYEISKLFGALFLYFEQLFEPTKKVIDSYNDYSLSLQFKPFLEKFEDYCKSKSDGYTGKMKDYILLLKKFTTNEKLMEREEQKYLQEAAVFLNEYLDFLKYFYKEFLPEQKNSQKNSDFIKANIDFIKKILTDFRMTGFKKQKTFKLGDYA